MFLWIFETYVSEDESVLVATFGLALTDGERRATEVLTKENKIPDSELRLFAKYSCLAPNNMAVFAKKMGLAPTDRPMGCIINEEMFESLKQLNKAGKQKREGERLDRKRNSSRS